MKEIDFTSYQEHGGIIFSDMISVINSKSWIVHHVSVKCRIIVVSFKHKVSCSARIFSQRYANMIWKNFPFWAYSLKKDILYKTEAVVNDSLGRPTHDRTSSEDRFCFAWFWMEETEGRTDTTCEYSDHYRSLVDRPSGSTFTDNSNLWIVIFVPMPMCWLQGKSSILVACWANNISHPCCTNV